MHWKDDLCRCCKCNRHWWRFVCSELLEFLESLITLVTLKLQEEFCVKIFLVIICSVQHLQHWWAADLKLWFRCNIFIKCYFLLMKRNVKLSAQGNNTNKIGTKKKLMIFFWSHNSWTDMRSNLTTVLQSAYSQEGKLISGWDVVWRFTLVKNNINPEYSGLWVLAIFFLLLQKKSSGIIMMHFI